MLWGKTEKSLTPVTKESFSFSTPFKKYAFLIDFTAGWFLSLDSDNSEIVFQNPVTPIQYVIHGSLVDNFNQFNSHLYKVKPETDLALFFPGWLRHYVAKNHASDRISYAFDTKVVDNDW